MALTPRLLPLVAALCAILGCTPAAAPAAAPTAAAVSKPAAAPSASTSVPAAAAPLQTTTVRIGIAQGLQDAPQLLAMDRGYFREQGIEIELTPFATAVDMIAPLAAGQLEVGTGSLNAGVFNAAARAIPIRIVADAGRIGSPERPFNALVVRKELYDSGQVRTVEDLRGRKVNVIARGNLFHLLLDRAASQAGFQVADDDVMTLPLPDTAAALSNGSIDATFLFEPFLSSLVANGIGVVLKPGAEIFPNHHISVVMFAPSFADDRPDVARRWMVAYLRGIRDYNAAFLDGQDMDSAIAIFVQHLPIKDPAIYRRMAVPVFSPDGRVDGANIAEQQDAYVRMGMVATPVDLNKSLDNRFSEAAARELR